MFAFRGSGGSKWCSRVRCRSSVSSWDILSGEVGTRRQCLDRGPVGCRRRRGVSHPDMWRPSLRQTPRWDAPEIQSKIPRPASPQVEEVTLRWQIDIFPGPARSVAVGKRSSDGSTLASQGHHGATARKTPRPWRLHERVCGKDLSILRENGGLCAFKPLSRIGRDRHHRGETPRANPRSQIPTARAPRHPT